MQIDNILILLDNNLANTEKDAIGSAKIMRKNREHLNFIYPLKFHNAQIKLDSNKIILIKKSHIGVIFPVIDHVRNSNCFMEIIKKKLLLKE